MTTSRQRGQSVGSAAASAPLAAPHGDCRSARLPRERHYLRSDATARSGSATLLVGSRYDQMPGWPLGFGDDKKALAMLVKGMEINPDGIDAHFFYGDFLRDRGD